MNEIVFMLSHLCNNSNFFFVRLVYTIITIFENCLQISSWWL